MNKKLLLLTAVVFCVSCKHEYLINLINNTNYKLIGVSNDFGCETRRITLDSGQQSGSYSVIYNTLWANMFGDGGLCFGVDTAINANGLIANVNYLAYFVPRGSLSENKTNEFKIIKIIGNVQDSTFFSYTYSTQ